MSEGHSTDFARVCQEKFSPFPDHGKFSIQQWAAILDRKLDTVSQHFEEKAVPCIPLGTLVIVEAADLWAAIPKQAFQRRLSTPRKKPDAPKKTRKRRRNDLQDP